MKKYLQKPEHEIGLDGRSAIFVSFSSFADGEERTEHNSSRCCNLLAFIRTTRHGCQHNLTSRKIFPKNVCFMSPPGDGRTEEDKQL